MVSKTYEAKLVYEIGYTRSQAKTHERLWHYCIGDPTLSAAGGSNTGTGYLRSVLEAPCARCWDRYKITGTVIDVDGNPVDGAGVYLLRGDNKGYSAIQHLTTGADGVYLFYVEDKETEYMVESWKWVSGSGEYIRGVSDRNLKAVAS